MVEKTIFIVKPIYVPVPVAASTVKSEAGRDTGFPLTSKKKLKVKGKVQKNIYMDKSKPPNYMNANTTALD